KPFQSENRFWSRNADFSKSGEKESHGAARNIVVEANKEHLILPEELENLTDSEWLALKDSTEKWFCKALYEGQHFAAIIVQLSCFHEFFARAISARPVGCIKEGTCPVALRPTQITSGTADRLRSGARNFSYQINNCLRH
uniref:Myosin motor domain-containing protein n=1 Tax=Macrostomum lignano TaxID=282301 RepID=A0A1I8IIV1_9PLAT